MLKSKEKQANNSKPWQQHRMLEQARRVVRTRVSKGRATVREAIGGTGQGVESRLTILVWMARNSRMGYPKGLLTPGFRSRGTRNTDLQKVGVGLRKLYRKRDGWTPHSVVWASLSLTEQTTDWDVPVLGLQADPMGFPFQNSSRHFHLRLVVRLSDTSARTAKSPLIRRPSRQWALRAVLGGHAVMGSHWWLPCMLDRVYEVCIFWANTGRHVLPTLKKAAPVSRRRISSLWGEVWQSSTSLSGASLGA